MTTEKCLQRTKLVEFMPYANSHTSELQTHLHSSKPQSSSTTSRSLCLCFGLQNFRDLHLYVEEFGGAAIYADTFALVEFSFAVVFGDAFLQASLGKSSINLSIEDSKVELSRLQGKREMGLGRNRKSQHTC